MKKSAVLLVGMVMVVLLLAPAAWARREEGGTSIVISGPNVYIAWSTPPAGEDYDQVFFRRSQDGGSNWLAQKQLTFDSNGTAGPALAVSGSNVFIVYEGYDISHMRQIFLLQSTNRGAAWQAPFQLSDTTSFVVNPRVVATGSTIIVFWEEIVSGFVQVVYSRSTTNGSTWIVPQVLHSSNGTQFDTTVAAEGQTIVVAYSEMGGSAEYVKFLRSLNGGATWQDSLNVISVNGTSANAQKINLDGLQVGILWVGNGVGTYQAMFSKSYDGGLSWLPAVQASQAPDSIFESDLAHSGAFGYVAYSGASVPAIAAGPLPVNARVYFARSLNTGLTWNLPKAVSPTTRSCNSPSVAAAESQVLVAYWAMKTNSLGFELTLYLRRSADNGATWQPAKIIGKGQILLH
jgi:hypothetical protein